MPSPATALLIPLAGLVALLTALAGELTAEPWPAPIFPGFGQAPTGPTVVHTVTVTGADGNQTGHGMHQLFADAPSSHRPALMSSLIDAEPSLDLQHWFEDRTGTGCVESVVVDRTVIDRTATTDKVNSLMFPCPQPPGNQ